MSWVSIHKAEVTDNINAVHCDTRDFKVSICEEMPEGLQGKPWWQVRNDERFLVAQEEVMPLLCRLEEMTGGKGAWRMMNFKNIKTHDGWFKYVRLYRVSPTHFIVTDGHYGAQVSKLIKENLDEEYLCFSK